MKEEILDRLKRFNGALLCVDDLCGLSARKDPKLQTWAGLKGLVVVACYPRAVKWLFEAGGAPLSDAVMFLNMRDQSAETILSQLPKEEEARCCCASRAAPAEEKSSSGWVPWFPVIDYSLCIHCRQCMEFCLFDVFRLTEEKKVEVRNPANCKTNCPACARICPKGALMFPKYKAGMLSGGEVGEGGVEGEAVQVDLDRVLQGDIYEELRKREKRSCCAFSTEQNEEKAREERRRCSCMADLQQTLDIPSDVLANLSMNEVADGMARRKKQAEEEEGDGSDDAAGGCSCS